MHGMQTTAVIISSLSIKNSLQQMKHDSTKRNSSIKSTTTAPKQRVSASIEQAPVADDDDSDDDEVTEL